MKKILMAICCLALVAALCGGALADLSDLQVPTLNDMLIRHRVLLADEGDGYEEYIVVFYVESSHVLMQFNDETHFSKDSGITPDYLRSVDISQLFDGFDDMDFADRLVSDEGDYCSLVVRFKHLDDLANQAKMEQYNTFTENGVFVHDADTMIDYLVESGMRELDMSEYGGKGLSFEVE